MSYLVFKVSSFLLSLISIVRSDVQMFDKKEIEIYQYMSVTPQKSEPVSHEKLFMTMMLIGGGGDNNVESVWEREIFGDLEYRYSLL